MKRQKLLQHGGITLVALVLLVLALAVPGDAQAQGGTTTFVSNQFTGQDGAYYIVGSNPSSQIVGQRFRTGTGTIHAEHSRHLSLRRERRGRAQEP